MLRKPLARHLGRALLPTLLAAVGAVAQDAPVPDEDAGYFEEIAVDIVNVEVYVTDSEGLPVEGLTMDDFEVLEDRKPVELLNFYSVFDGRPRSLPEPVAEVETPESEPSTPPGLEFDRAIIPEEQSLNLIVYVDNLFIHPLNRNRVFSRLRSFLDRTVEPGDKVLIASFDRSLHIRHPLSSDTNSVLEALDELEKVTGYAASREQERMEAVQAIYETNSIHTALFEASTFADNAMNEANDSLDGLREMIESLAGLPGRKMLIHVSDGLPTVPGQDLYQAVQQVFRDQTALSEAMGYDLSQRYVELTALANSNRVTFYTIDAAGLRTVSGLGAEHRATYSPTGVNFAVDAVRTSNLQDTLIIMADRTGGQAIFNTNDVSDGLERFRRDFENYYSLGYRAPVSDRGRYHDIEVRLRNKQKGWRVRHREGYRDKSIDARIQDAIAANFVHDHETNALGASLDLGPQTRGEDGNFDVAIRVRIPLANVALVPRQGFYEGLVRLYLSATDEEGKKAPVQEMPLELRIPEASIEIARQDEVARVLDLTMRAGPHKIVVAVRDEVSELRSVLGTYVMVGGR